MPTLELNVASGEALSVRRFLVRERISEPFEVVVLARSHNSSVDLDAIVGLPASFRIVTGMAGALHHERSWSGICRRVELDQAEPNGLSTYRFEIVPSLWLLTQRRDHRILQHRSAPAIAAAVLDRWGIERVLALDDAHPPLPYKVQYAETDYAFFCRILEEAGIVFTFSDREGQDVLTLSDRLHACEPRPVAIPFEASPNEAAEKELVTEVRLADETRPGAYTLRDHDLRRPTFGLVGEAEKAPGIEAAFEQYHYQPGASLMDTTPSGDTPVADDEGAARHDAAFARRSAQGSLESERHDKWVVTYRTNALDLWPGRVFSIAAHPHPHLDAARRLLATELALEGAPGEAWTILGRATFADVPYRPRRSTPRPRAWIQSATVVGGEEIHPDELGRVRVQFPWDRNGDYTCWVRVSQGWAGAAYGMMMLPREGNEVLVDFLEGDPEQPVVVGRVFNRTNPVIEKLPEHQTRSAWKSDASGGFNEILFEDAKGSELVYAQAERDARRLVKHDDTSTIVRDRRKDVGVNELETTGANRVQETRRDRVELTYGDQTTAVDGTRRERVEQQALERIEGKQVVTIGKDLHLVTNGTRRELVEHDAHLSIDRSRQESIGGTDSLTVGKDMSESVGDYSVDASGPDGWIHLVAGSAIVIESDADVTVKGAGGFVKVDPGGVTIVGAEVVINEGGSPGSLSGPGTHLPEPAQMPIVNEPTPPSEPPPRPPATMSNAERWPGALP